MKDNPGYCAYPSFHIQVKPNGMYKPCCRFDVREAEKMQSTKSPFEAFYGNVWRDLRARIDRGEEIAGCEKCFRQEKNQGSSMRLDNAAALDFYGHRAPDVALKFVEMAFGNFCNLRCRTCTGNLSSKWHADEELLRERLDFRAPASREKIIDAQMLPTLDPVYFRDVEHIKFTGGEPMLHADFLPFLDFLVQAGRAPHITLRVCTNASYSPKGKMRELLARFRRIVISLSIDGYGSHNDYLRNPSKWETVERVSREWIELADQDDRWEVNLCTTVSAPSLIALPPLLKWWGEIGGGRKVIYQPVFDPPYLSPEILPKAFVSTFDLPREISGFFSAKMASPENISRFFEFNSALDEIRGESMLDAFPELEALC